MGSRASTAPIRRAGDIELAPDLILSLHAFTFTGAARLRIRLLETGGLLAGSLDDAPVADRLEEIQCEHRFGPQFTLSDADAYGVAQLINQIQQTGDRRVLGYFRTGSGTRTRPGEQDSERLRELLPDCRLVVIGEPLPQGASVLRRYTPDGHGGWTLDGELEGAAVARPAHNHRPRVVPAPRTMPSRRVPKRMRVAAVCAASCIALGLAWFTFGRSGTARVESGLGLHVQIQGPGVLVNWDRQSAAIRHAQHAVLRIQDGSEHREISLNRSELSGGSVLYQSGSDDVSFQLQVDGSPAAPETVRLLRAQAPQLTARTTAVLPAPALVAQAPAPFKSPLTDTRPAGISRATTGESSRSAVHPTPRRSGRDEHLFAPPPTHRLEPPASSKDLPMPPSEPPPTARDSSGLATLDSVLGHRLAPPSYDLAVTPEQPLRRVSPTMNGEVATFVKSPVSVVVEVTIDERGAVRKARLVNASPQTNQFLIVESLRAASQWTFSPALRQERPIASTHRITFAFKPLL